MNPFLLHAGPKKLKDPSQEQGLVPFSQPPHSLTEGSEFLDDAIRIIEQPLVYTEESIAPGSPDDLL